MNTRSVEAWIPIRTPAWDHPSRLPIYENARDQFMKQLPEVLQSLGSDVEVEEVSLGVPPSELAAWFAQKSFMNGTKLFEYLCIRATVEVDSDWLVSEPAKDEGLVLAVAASQLGNKIELVLILSELAYPGCIDALDGACISSNLLIQQIQHKHTFRHLTFPDDEDPVWPPIQMVDLAQVAAWAMRTNMPSNHLAKSRIERALAAYSHVIGLSWLRDGEGLFRAMQGLEAFYSDGVGDLRKQLSEKVQLWLGPWQENKNIVGRLYDLRSAFVHGSARLVYWGRQSGAWDEDETEMQRFDSGVKLSIRLLIATLQRCVIDDVTEIRWSYSFTVVGNDTGA